MYGHTYSKSMDQPGKVANPARGQLNRKNEYFPVRVRIANWCNIGNNFVNQHYTTSEWLLVFRRVLALSVTKENENKKNVVSTRWGINSLRDSLSQIPNKRVIISYVLDF